MTPAYMARLFAAFAPLTAFLPEHPRYGTTSRLRRPDSEPAMVTVARHLEGRQAQNQMIATVPQHTGYYSA